MHCEITLEVSKSEFHRSKIQAEGSPLVQNTNRRQAEREKATPTFTMAKTSAATVTFETMVVVLGLYVFFHHEGDFKDGGTKERAVQNLPERHTNPRPKAYESDALPPELSRPPTTFVNNT